MNQSYYFERIHHSKIFYNIFIYCIKKKKAACKLYKYKASKFPNQASELESFSHKDTVLSTQNIIQKMFSGLDWAV